MKRLAIILLISVCLGMATTASVQAGAYPDKPINIIVPMPPGAAGDVTARIIAPDLAKILGTEIVVLNKPGASLTLGTDMVARSKKDGYTIAYTATSGIIYARVTKPEIVPYNPDTDLEPLALHLFFPLTIAVQASSPWKTLADLVAYAKENPGKVRVGTHGQASIDHFNMEITQTVTGAKFTAVPFKGGQATIAALLGGHVEVIYDAITKTRPHLDAGKFRILAVSKKLVDNPEIPTFEELGYKQGLLSAWFAIYAPAGIPEDVKNKLVPAFKQAINNPELKAKINAMGYLVDYKSPAELKKIATDDYKTALGIYQNLKN